MTGVLYHSDFPPPPPPVGDYGQFLWSQIVTHPGQRLAVVDGPTRITYAELCRRVEHCATACEELLAAGVLHRDRPVILALPNSSGMIIALLALLRQGILIAPVHAQLRPGEISAHADLIGAAAVVVPGATAGHLCVRTPGGEYHLPVAGYTAEPAPPRPRTPADPAVLVCTSGTTGQPRVAVLSHANLSSNAAAFTTALGSPGAQRLLVLLPLSHIYGLTVLFGRGLLQGCTLVLQQRFDPTATLELIAAEGITQLFVVPPLVRWLATLPDSALPALATVTLVLSGAAPLDTAVATRLHERLGCAVRQGYGMTELSPVSHVSGVADTAVPVAALGRAVGGVRWRVVDPHTGQDARRGELWVAGPGVMQGYWQPGDDVTAPTGGGVDAQGFVHTGDLVEVHDSPVGPVPILTDRLKDVLNIRGYTVSPVELERVLAHAPGVRDAAVAAVALDGEDLPVGFVCSDRPLGEDQLLDFVSQRVAPYKRLRRVLVVPEIPRSASGKTLRRELRAWGALELGHDPHAD